VIGRYFLHGHLQFNCPVEDAYKFNTLLANLLKNGSLRQSGPFKHNMKDYEGYMGKIGNSQKTA